MVGHDRANGVPHACSSTGIVVSWPRESGLPGRTSSLLGALSVCSRCPANGSERPGSQDSKSLPLKVELLYIRFSVLEVAMVSRKVRLGGRKRFREDVMTESE